MSEPISAKNYYYQEIDKVKARLSIYTGLKYRCKFMSPQYKRAVKMIEYAEEEINQLERFKKLLIEQGKF